MNMLINHDSVLSVKLIITSIKTLSTVLDEEVVTTKEDSGSYDDTKWRNCCNFDLHRYWIRLKRTDDQDVECGDGL